MREPLISILIPFKNTSAFLKECLDSILRQAYVNWELLIVDDGSDDDSNAIVGNYANLDNRIKLYKNPGDGIIEALRHAYHNSQGELITRMDSDDIMSPNKLKVLHESLVTKGTGHIAIGQVHYFSENGVGTGYKNYEQWLNKLTETGSNYSDIYKECVIPSPCWMLHREDLDKIGAFNPNTYPEDYDMTFRCYEYDLKCIPCDSVLHDWRDYSTRTSRTHEHYADNQFLDLKLHYFFKLNHDSNRPLVIWGAGNRGKTLAKKLIEKEVSFYWICDNPNKIGRDIYGKVLLEIDYLIELDKPQSIITVTNTQAQQEIKQYMASQSMKPMKDYFFFC